MDLKETFSRKSKELKNAIQNLEGNLRTIFVVLCGWSILHLLLLFMNFEFKWFKGRPWYPS